MSAIVVCLDCHHYQTGGYCRKKRRDVGALNPACEEINKPSKEEKDMSKLAPQIKTKTCTKCGRELPISEFYARTGAKDGLQTICKTCHSIKTKESIARRKAKAESAESQGPPQKVVVRETLTDEQMVMALRAHGWTVTCTRTITEEL